MSTPDIEAYHDARADAFAAVEQAVESTHERRVDRVVELLHDPAERDPGVWGDYLEFYDIGEEYFDDPILDLNDVPLEERDKYWHDVVTAFVDASMAQAFAETTAVELVDAMQSGAIQTLDAARDMTTRDVRLIGRTGIARFDAAKKKRNGGDATT